MRRRTLLVGIGSAAIGTGTAIGAGAFTQTEADRSVNVDVAADSAAFVALEDHQSRAAVDASSANAIQIDLSSSLYSAGDGVNDKATIRVGDGDIGATPMVGQGAFRILNQTGGDLNITISPTSNDADDARLYLGADTAGDATVDTSEIVSDGSTSSSLTIAPYDSGSGSDSDWIEVAVEVDTNGSISTNPTFTVNASQP